MSALEINSLGILVTVGILAFGLLLSVFWLWALVDCARRISAGDTGLVGWLIAICLTHALGAVAYFLFGRRSTIAVTQAAPGG